MEHYSPDRMFAKLEDAAEKRAHAEYVAHRLERLGEILLGNLMWQAKLDGVPATLCKEVARTKDEWATHIEGEAEAIKDRSKARASYENLKILAEARRTEESSRRALTK